MRTLSFSGSRRAIGRAFGESTRAETHALYALRVDNAIRQALTYGGRVVDERALLEVATRSLAITERYDPAGFEELRGVAEGADLPLVRLLAMNGLTDFRDVLSWPAHPESADQCSAFVIQGDHTADGQLLCGQTWDLATDNLPFVLAVHRVPDDAPETWSLTTAGCLSLIGLNDRGLAVGTTNVRTTDARPGVCYLSVIHKALSQTTYDAALSAIVDAPRAGAHFFWLGDAAGRAAAVECSARRAHVTDVVQGAYVHTNHCVVPANIAIQGAPPSSSSLARERRLAELITARAGAITADDGMAFFADTAGGADAICRDDIDGLNTNGAVVVAPERGEIWACHGVPTKARWTSLKTSSEMAVAKSTSEA